MVPRGPPVGPITGNDPAERCDLAYKRGLTHWMLTSKRQHAVLAQRPTAQWQLGGNKTGLGCCSGACHSWGVFRPAEAAAAEAVTAGVHEIAVDAQIRYAEGLLCL